MIENPSLIKENEIGKDLLCIYYFDSSMKSWITRDVKITKQQLQNELELTHDFRASIIEEKPIDYEITLFQCFYTPDVRKQTIRILNKILCVFASLALVNFVDSVIIRIAHGSKHLIAIECSLLLIYALLAHGYGRYVYYHFVFVHRSPWIEKIHAWQADHLVEEFLIEHSAFAWKEFSEKFIFTGLYQPFYEGSMALWVLIWTCMALLANYILHYFTFFRYDNHKKQTKLYQFDNHSFALSIAFLLTVTWLNFFDVKGIGAEFHEVFFSWESHSRSYQCHHSAGASNSTTSHHDDDDYYSPREIDKDDYGQFYRFILYPFVVLLFITSYFFLEDIIIVMLRKKKLFRNNEQPGKGNNGTEEGTKSSQTSGEGRTEIRSRKQSIYSVSSISQHIPFLSKLITPMEIQNRDRTGSGSTMKSSMEVKTLSMQLYSFVRSTWKFFRIFLG